MSRGILVAIVLLVLAAVAALLYVGGGRPRPASISPADPAAALWIVTPPPGYQIPPDITGPDDALRIVKGLLEPDVHIVESHVAHTTEGRWQIFEAGPDARLMTLAPNETPGAGDPRSEQARAEIWVVGIRTEHPVKDLLGPLDFGDLPPPPGSGLVNTPDYDEGDEAHFVLSPLGEVTSVGLSTQLLDGQMRRIVPWALADIDSLAAP